MKLEFGKYTDITNFAKKVDPSMYDMYEKIYICPDTNNWWVAMIQKDVDENYDECPGAYLIERNNPDYPNYGKCPNSVFVAPESHVRQVLEDWDGSCWDNYQAYSLHEAIEVVDGGWGIIPEEE